MKDKRVLNCKPSRNTERDWGVGEASVAAPTTTAAAAGSVDLRADWWAIDDQGSTGSCVGWAVAQSVLRWHFVTAGWLPRDQRLSARYVWMAAKESDEFTTRPTTFIEREGTSVKAALDVARKFGVVTEETLHFSESGLFPGEAQAFYAKAAGLKIASYFNLGADPSQWRRWLANGRGPIATRLSVDATWDAAASSRGVLDVYRPETARGGHAVAIVGFTERQFIVRNSWGTEWGDIGFAYASDAYATAAFGSELYGIVL